MDTFPFLGLPLVVQREVTSTLNVIDILLFSLVSPEAYNVARKVQRIEKLTWSFEDEIDSDVQLTEKEDKLYWYIQFPEPENLAERREETLEGKEYSTVFSPATIKGVPIFVSNMKSYSETAKYIMVDYSVESKEHQLTLIKLFTEHCIGLFRIQKYTACFNSPMPPIVDCFIFNYTKKLDSIELTKEDDMTAEEFKFIFGKIEFSEAWLFTELPSDHAYLGPMKTDEIHMSHTGWLAMETILNSETKSIFSFEGTLTDADWNTIIKKWMDGGLQKLQKFHMNVAANTDHDHAQILDGIPHITFNEHNRPVYYRKLPEFVGYDWTNAWDFQKADGIWATLSIGADNFGWRRRIELFVWLKKYTLKFDL